MRYMCARIEEKKRRAISNPFSVSLAAFVATTGLVNPPHQNLSESTFFNLPLCASYFMILS